MSPAEACLVASENRYQMRWSPSLGKWVLQPIDGQLPPTYLTNEGLEKITEADFKRTYLP